MHFLIELLRLGMEHSVTLTRDKEIHRRKRRMFNQALGPRRTREYEPVQLTESRKMIMRLLETPEDLDSHVYR